MSGTHSMEKAWMLGPKVLERQPRTDKLDVELNDELDVALNDELDVELNDELDVEFNGELDVEFNDELDVELNDKLDAKLNDNSMLNSTTNSKCLTKIMRTSNDILVLNFNTMSLVFEVS
ncbi:jg21671 [Pararge aegeria aegeria]|uniref:Jg21671 protein n=1 Tax=Pararge aegeria aegeria TaxID=348720 RepID=A0A8S4QM89_9NEOP|nr:jg21671 [Pararge aegeria aegeria]